MPDCRGVGESRTYSKRAKKSAFAGFVPQSDITDCYFYLGNFFLHDFFAWLIIFSSDDIKF